jgi:Zn-finger nucleic acid-binding protein
MDLTCPKCHGTMRTYERNGVHVDQCSDCRGIFLDRGELDRLVDAENSWHGSAPQQAADRPDSPQHEPPAASGGGLGAVVGDVLRQVQGARSSQQSSHQQSSHQQSQYGYKKRKKESFLGDLFG